MFFFAIIKKKFSQNAFSQISFHIGVVMDSSQPLFSDCPTLSLSAEMTTKKKKIPFIKIVCLLVEHVYILCKILGTAFLWCQFLVYLRRWFFFWLNYTKSKVCVIIYFQYFENSDRFKKVSKLYHFLFI